MRKFEIEDDLWLQSIYMGEMKSLCEQIEFAVQGLNQYLAAAARVDKTRGIFFFLRSIVQITANVSQFLWAQEGSNARVRRRATTLRKPLSISENSILKSRSFRHHLMHMDERLDRWAVESPRRNIVRQMVAPRNAFRGDSFSSGDFFEHYVQEEHTFIFRGDEFRVQDIVDEVVAIKNRVIELEGVLRNSRLQSEPSSV